MPKFQPNDLNGVMPAMITSFNKDESINKEGLRNIINHSINEKVNLNTRPIKWQSFFLLLLCA